MMCEPVYDSSDMDSATDSYINHIAELRRENKVLNAALKEVKCELAALLPDPANPDFMPALSNSNIADDICLRNAWYAVKAALAEKEVE